MSDDGVDWSHVKSRLNREINERILRNDFVERAKWMLSSVDELQDRGLRKRVDKRIARNKRIARRRR